MGCAQVMSLSGGGAASQEAHNPPTFPTLRRVSTRQHIYRLLSLSCQHHPRGVLPGHTHFTHVRITCVNKILGARATRLNTCVSPLRIQGSGFGVQGSGFRRGGGGGSDLEILERSFFSFLTRSTFETCPHLLPDTRESI